MNYSKLKVKCIHLMKKNISVETESNLYLLVADVYLRYLFKLCTMKILKINIHLRNKFIMQKQNKDAKQYFSNSMI